MASMLSSKCATPVAHRADVVSGARTSSAQLPTARPFGWASASTSTCQVSAAIHQVASQHSCGRQLRCVVVCSQAGTGGGRPAKKKVKKLVDINGDVTKDLGNGMFTVKLENGVSVMAHLSGKIRQFRIKILAGDKVTVELSPYDLTRGRITYRFKPGELAAAGAATASQDSA